MKIFRATTLINHLPRWMAATITLTSIADASISIQNFSAAVNDRFANNPSFVGTGYDWSGIGRDSYDTGRWVTMITPNVFLSATHWHPDLGATVTFYPGNDPAAPSVSEVVAGAQQIGGTDLWIGYLANALPSSIVYYSTVPIPITPANFATSGLAGAFTFMSGISPTDTGYGAAITTEHALGTNRVEGFTNLSLGGSTGDTLVTVRNQANEYGYTLTTSEAQLNVGDSGSPLMVISGGNLYVAGIAWAIGTVDIDPGAPEVLRNISLYTYTGNYDAAIQDYIGLYSVPEPSVLMLFAGMVVFIRRRR